MTLLRPVTLTVTIAATGVGQRAWAVQAVKLARGGTLHFKSANNATGVTYSSDDSVYLPTQTGGMAPGSAWDLPRPAGGALDTALDLYDIYLKGTIGDVIYVYYYPAS